MLRRRLSAGLCAVVLMAALVAYPLRARAMASATLAAVGGATVIAATLAACGIYPYASAGESSFGEWGARALTDLLEKYNQAHIESAIRMEQVRAYVVGRTLAVGREVWNKLRDFAAWVRDTYLLADNQTENRLGETLDGRRFIPVLPDGQNITRDNVYRYGVIFSQGPISSGYRDVYMVSTNLPNTALARVEAVIDGKSGSYIVAVAPHDVTVDIGFAGKKMNVNTGSYWEYGLSRCSWYDANLQYNGYYVFRLSSVENGWEYPDVPVFSDLAALIKFFYGGGGLQFKGITADTATVSVPAALPVDNDSEFVGLSVYPGTVSGVDVPVTAMTPQAVEEIIQQGVMSRERPVVKPVEIEVEAGTTVDTETGEVATESAEPIVISPTTIPLQASDYAIPSLSSVFPFSIPWDIMRIWQALDAEPRFPLQDFSLTLDVPWLFGDAPPTVRFGLDAFPEAVATKMDEVAEIVRYGLLLVACVGFLIFVSQFIKF